MGRPPKGTYFKCKCGKHFRTLQDYQRHFRKGFPPIVRPHPITGVGEELYQIMLRDRKAYRKAHHLIIDNELPKLQK